MLIADNLRHIFAAEGVRGLYRGLFPSLVSVVPSISIYFTLYSEIKQALGVPENGKICVQFNAHHSHLMKAMQKQQSYSLYLLDLHLA